MPDPQAWLTKNGMPIPGDRISAAATALTFMWFGSPAAGASMNSTREVGANSRSLFSPTNWMKPLVVSASEKFQVLVV